MGSMMRRMTRTARRRLGELLDRTYNNIASTADLAEELENYQALAWCENALDRLDYSLTNEGWPTDLTWQLLPEIIDGVGDLLQELQPTQDSRASLPT
jgi:hypothetical protein